MAEPREHAGELLPDAEVEDLHHPRYPPEGLTQSCNERKEREEEEEWKGGCMSNEGEFAAGVAEVEASTLHPKTRDCRSADRGRPRYVDGSWLELPGTAAVTKPGPTTLGTPVTVCSLMRVRDTVFDLDVSDPARSPQHQRDAVPDLLPFLQ